VGPHSFGMDRGVMEHVDWVNIACGWHAGDPEAMDRTVRAAVEGGLGIGAHPGLPDVVGFGRREMRMEPEEVENLMLYQVGSLCAFLKRRGAELHHVKPHGALYGMLARDEELARAAVRVAALFEVPMLGMAGTAHEVACKDLGVPLVAELYVDLDYRSDGSLIIERHPAPKASQQAAGRVLSALSGQGVEAVDGTRLQITFESICIHSDIANAPAMAHAVREAVSHASEPSSDNSAG
jgi:5-oxoprolinase (ATP-hydrolysing) subunit A